MARRRRSGRLVVGLNGRPVGTYERAASGAVSFAYDPRWLEADTALPLSLSLPLREDRYIGAPVSAVFENMLPDGEPLRRRIAERVGAASADPFDLLAQLGRDCVGAVQLVAEDGDLSPPSPPDGEPLTEAQIADRLRGLAAAPLGLMRDEDAFRISIAGAHEKTALLRTEDGWALPRAETPTTHILKPSIGRLPSGIDLSDSVLNEHFCMQLLSGLGLPVAQTEVAHFEDISCLIVRRFDRRLTADGRLLRLPQEDFCQALSVPSVRKYESDGGPGLRDCLALLLGADEPLADRATFLRTQIAFWAIGATDGHAKNFSLHLRPGGLALTPLYDVLSAEPYVARSQVRHNEQKLSMAIGASRHYRVRTINRRHFHESAKAFGVPAEVVDEAFSVFAAKLDDAISAAVQSLPGPADGLTEPIVAAARKRLETVP